MQNIYTEKTPAIYMISGHNQLYSEAECCNTWQ